MDHLDRVRQEFARQADHFATATALTDDQLTARFVSALGPAAEGTILDVACGPGIITAALAARARAVAALDLTPAMLAKARQRCAAAGHNNVTFHEASATELPFPDHSFDAVVTRLSIHHFEHPSLVLAEINRVLRPDRTFVLADVISSESPEQSALQNAIEVLRDPSHIRMLPATELTALVEQAGFAIAAQTTWDTPREYEEWVGIVADPERVAPLRIVVRALARAGETAGMDLALTDNRIVFTHRWQMIVAQKRHS